MTDISIVIVNYNVKDFLHQCLLSIEKASNSLSIDVWVVDNNSVDGSKKYLKSIESNPKIHCILNDKNVGFSTANNQAIRQCDSKYVMLLNPDTVIQEDTLVKCYDKMESDLSIGALGVRMIDGVGEFLPESKRGFPTLWASFTKMSGLSKLAPKSKSLNAYYCGHIDEYAEGEIDVLCGANMFVRASILERVGLLDEDFFMYGEDIDWSYRIQQSGSKVYYYPASSIIHYKGESTKKTSLTYLRTFYNAMIIFINKHFEGGSFLLLKTMLSVAIYFRATLSWFINQFKKCIHPIVDFLSFYGALLLVKTLWAKLYFEDILYFDTSPIHYNILSYAVIWIISLYILGNYDRSSHAVKLFKGLFWGLIVILIMYALLPSSLRSSRVLILLGFPFITGLAVLSKYCHNYLRQKRWDLTIPSVKSMCIVGDKEDIIRIEQQLQKVHLQNRVQARISIQPTQDNFFVNDIERLVEVVGLFKINEIIFSSNSLSFGSIFFWMQRLGSKYSYKIASQDEHIIIGSNSKNEMGEVYTYQFEMGILDEVNIRLKRLLDIVFSIVILILSPLLWLLHRQKMNILSSTVDVLYNQKTWIGYTNHSGTNEWLPAVKKAIFDLTRIISKERPNAAEIRRIKLEYAKNYTLWKDVELYMNLLLHLFNRSYNRNDD